MARYLGAARVDVKLLPVEQLRHTATWQGAGATAGLASAWRRHSESRAEELGP